MAQGEVGDRVRAIADTVWSACADLHAAHESAAEARDDLAVALLGGDSDTHTEAVGLLSATVSAMADAAALTPVRVVAAKATPTLGRWKGKTATEHVHAGGVDIGRPPKGVKNMPIRLVDSVDELDSIFRALSPGRVLVERSTYKGDLYSLPDGTTIGYRTQTGSGDDDPTLDLKIAGTRLKLKIHVSEGDGS